MKVRERVESILALVGFLVLSPLVGAAAVYSILRRRSVVFQKEAIGQFGRPIKVFKLRTMHRLADVEGGNTLVTFSQDPRTTASSRFIRRAKIDEIPQLLNVFNGSMALVGPRPLSVEKIDLYGDDLDIIFSVKPGMTGLGSLRYFDEQKLLPKGLTYEDQTRYYDEVIMPTKLALERYYVANRSLVIDVQIVALTIVSLATRRCIMPRIPVEVEEEMEAIAARFRGLASAETVPAELVSASLVA
jgi:lipopolysaccharide/colanic/teichoic acid biosynthesis glycosyltransferase